MPEYGIYDPTSQAATWRDIARSPVRTVGPSIPVLTVEQVKDVINIEHSDKDGMIADDIEAATAMVEDEAEIVLLTSTWTLTLDCFPAWTIELRRLPVQSITSVVYLDSSGVSTTLSASLYRLATSSKPARLTPAYNQTWPTTYPVADSVVITFVAGNTTIPAIHPDAKKAIKFLAAHFWRAREAVVATGAQPIEMPLAYDACLSRLKWSGGV